MKQNKLEIIKSFPAVINTRSRIMILGTMPGPASIRAKQYYAFTGNHFWKIIFRLFEVREALAYTQKTKLLTAKRIALWDVFRLCKRKGALDSNIRKPQYNKISSKLKKYPKIKAIFLNGRTAEKAFRKQFSGSVKIPAYYLPSTSPANASIAFKKKLKAWSVILKHLRP